MADVKSSSMRGDLASAYLASGSRVLGWMIVLGIVQRTLGSAGFAMFALVRTTLAVLNYAGLGLGPAMMGRGGAGVQGSAFREEGGEVGAKSDGGVYSSGVAIGILSGVLGIGVTVGLALGVGRLIRIPEGMGAEVMVLVLGMGVGTALRLGSDGWGAALQMKGRIALDNRLLAMAEWIWVGLTALVLLGMPARLANVGIAYAVSGAALQWMRGRAARGVFGFAWPGWKGIEGGTFKAILVSGLMITAAQLGDYLYAPTDCLLINWLIDPLTVGVYTPAIAIDSGLLLLVGGVAAVLLPKTAMAHAAGDGRRIRMYYLRGTLASAGMLAGGAAGAWALSGWIFWYWLHDSMIATQAILPLVLVHTVVGGSSAVGRSILLGMGKVKAFTVSVLVAGVANVFLSYVFVKYLNLGLRGIVLGTIVVVVGRCGIWMPWYVMRVVGKNRRDALAGPVLTYL